MHKSQFYERHLDGYPCTSILRSALKATDKLKMIPYNSKIELFQCSYVISGSCVFAVGDEKKTLKSGDCVFIPSGVSHKVEVLGDSVVIDVFTPMREDFV